MERHFDPVIEVGDVISIVIAAHGRRPGEFVAKVKIRTSSEWLVQRPIALLERNIHEAFRSGWGRYWDKVLYPKMLRRAGLMSGAGHYDG